MQLDNDLQSIQEMRDLVARAKQAQIEFRAYDQTRVDRIVKAMADAGFAAADRLEDVLGGGEADHFAAALAAAAIASQLSAVTFTPYVLRR